MKNFLANFDPDEWIRLGLAALFFGVGLFFTFIIGQVSTLTCNRTREADHCVLRVNWMGLAPLRETYIEGLQSAQVEESCDDEGDCTYRVVLITTRQRLPFEAAYSSGKIDKDEIAARINTFTRDPEIRTLEERTGGGFWLILPLVFVASGIYMALEPLKHAILRILGRE